MDSVTQKINNHRSILPEMDHSKQFHDKYSDLERHEFIRCKTWITTQFYGHEI